MSYYSAKKGLEHKAKSTISGATALLDVWTPGDALDDMRALDSAIRTLGQAVANSTVSAKFKAEYALFQNDWRAFYDDNVGSISAWFARGRYAFKARLESYQSLIDAWRKTYVEQGGKLPETPSRGVASSKFPWGWTLGVGILGGIAYFAFRDSGETVTFQKRAK